MNPSNAVYEFLKDEVFDAFQDSPLFAANVLESSYAKVDPKTRLTIRAADITQIDGADPELDPNGVVKCKDIPIVVEIFVRTINGTLQAKLQARDEAWEAAKAVFKLIALNDKLNQRVCRADARKIVTDWSELASTDYAKAGVLLVIDE